MAGGQPVPTVNINIKGKRGLLRINESDLPEWEKKGYKKVTLAEKKAAPPPVMEAPEPEEVEEEVDLPTEAQVKKLSVAKIEELNESFRLEVELDEYTTAGEKREAVLEALQSAGYYDEEE